ncbi:putative regulatory protein, FmdB family [Tritonibacter multivorans]|uniref:Putative regulatory protein, FmdB family n=1 Tax=Tritonibacter multivorans TaxID=928856 RepID=A0A0P1G487_9RHOB|nr:zinc ribbon domain-containing protein [Tritonibacter multivorans]MDA7421905.1 zinc ribbon domain-containing protein [Tritonibacter multivorans]CUH76620.1 putative regulatory protein, FmdB family [Tritonibacter multivorans]SFD48064.1 putative regulatory protein, FmdB family [Tritonibacter multivorans]
MPIYEYSCPDCGPFQSMGRMATSDAPCGCPICGTASPRITVAAPQLSRLDSGRRSAHSVNERASHSPKFSRDVDPRMKGQKITRRRETKSADGAKSFANKRPWMLSH